MSEKMIEAARARIKDPRAQFHRAIEVTEVGDYSFICGTYNMHLGANDVDWQAYIELSLAQVWEKSRKGLAFNLLSDRFTGERYPGLHYASAEDYMRFCKAHFSPKGHFQRRPKKGSIQSLRWSKLDPWGGSMSTSIAE